MPTSHQVIGTTNNTTDAVDGNCDVPDVRLESDWLGGQSGYSGMACHRKSGGGVALINKAGGRSASVWRGSAVAGRRIGQWVDDMAAGLSE